MQGFDGIRFERTSDQIAADRKAANAFFARYDKGHAKELERTVRFYGYAWNLVCCVIEATEWARTHPHVMVPDRVEAKKARAALELAEQIPAREESNRRAFVHVTTMRRMPPVGVPARPAGERLAARGEAARFWALCAKPTPRFRARIARDAAVPFAQWLLLNPNYGPVLDAPDGYMGTSRVNKPKRFGKRSIRPVGMDVDRAVEIALTVLNSK